MARTMTIAVGTPASFSLPTTQFAGNSFTGTGYNHAGSSGLDMGVAPDGIVITGTTWEESGHDVRVLNSSQAATGPFPGNSSGRFRENGGGPRAVHATSTSLYCVQARNIVKWSRTTWFGETNFAATQNGTTLAVSGTGPLMGITTSGSEVFITDAGSSVDEESPAGATIKRFTDLSGAALSTWTVARARKLATDRQGHIWCLQQRSGATSARVSRWTTTGTAEDAFDVSGEPMDIACHPTSDEVWVADNGSSQCIRRFQYGGTELANFGASYLSGPTPGVITGARFCGLRGVGFDSSGNVYAMNAFVPGRGTSGWRSDELGEAMMIAKYDSGGTESWRRYGIMGMPGEHSADLSKLYVNSITYMAASNKWEPYACNIDPFTNPSDPRYDATDLNHIEVNHLNYYREFGDEQFVCMLYGGPSTGEPTLYLYRLDGEIATHVVTFASSWKDQWIDEDGNVWQPQSNGTCRFREFTGMASGVPQYAAFVTIPAPAAFTDLRRVEVHGTTIYAAGYGPGGAEFVGGTDDWKIQGKRLARYNSLPTVGGGWPSPAWTTLVYWDTWPLQPTCMAADGADGLVAVGYLTGSTPSNEGYLRLYDPLTGVEDQRLDPATATFGPKYGWLDLQRSVVIRDDVIYFEGNGQAKTMIFPMPT